MIYMTYQARSASMLSRHRRTTMIAPPTKNLVSMRILTSLLITLVPRRHEKQLLKRLMARFGIPATLDPSDDASPTQAYENIQAY
jgi:hypothetical protein